MARAAKLRQENAGKLCLLWALMGLLYKINLLGVLHKIALLAVFLPDTFTSC